MKTKKLKSEENKSKLRIPFLVIRTIIRYVFIHNVFVEMEEFNFDIVVWTQRCYYFLCFFFGVFSLFYSYFMCSDKYIFFLWYSIQNDPFE